MYVFGSRGHFPLAQLRVSTFVSWSSILQGAHSSDIHPPDPIDQMFIHQTPSTRLHPPDIHPPDPILPDIHLPDFIPPDTHPLDPIHQTSSTRPCPPILSTIPHQKDIVYQILSPRLCSPGPIHQAPLQQTLPTMPLSPPAPLFLSFVLNCLQSCASGYSWFSGQYQLSLPVHLLP